MKRNTPGRSGTAIRGYERLESPGLWRPTPDAQRREVIVSIGAATLMLRDTAERPLAHWSLAAIRRLNGEETPALYGPGADAEDTLEIEDDTMTAAIETVRRAVAQARPRPGRLRLYFGLAGAVAVVALAAFWLPEALVRNAVAVVPEAKRAELGERLLFDIRRVAGAPCATPLGTRALGILHERLRGGAPGRIVVLRDGIRKAVDLPGGILLVNRSLVEDFEDPDVLAGYVLAEGLRSAQEDPIASLLHDSGALAALRLLTTGEVTDATLAAHAETLMSQPALPLPEEALLARFQAAAVPSSPYAFAEDASGETTLGLIEADPGRPDSAPPVLGDGEWISLQAICLN